MGIEKIKSTIVSMVQNVGKKGGAELKKVDLLPVDGLEKVSKKEKLTNSLAALSNNAKASIALKKEKLSQKNSLDAKVFKNGKKFHKEALIAEGKMFGLNDSQAKNAANALMSATGEFSYKDASKSAEILKDARLPEAVFKQELLAKQAQRAAQKAAEKLS